MPEKIEINLESTRKKRYFLKNDLFLINFLTKTNVKNGGTPRQGLLQRVSAFKGSPILSGIPPNAVPVEIFSLERLEKSKNLKNKDFN